MIAVCTLLCAGETFNDMEDFGLAKLDWFKTFLRLRNGIPSHDTFNRVLAALDPKAFLDCFLRWTQSVRQAVPQEIVALDGKALRRALAKDQSVQYIVSAWAESNGLVLGQIKVADKSNEITAVPELLRVLELSGCIVTLDAMGCQKKIAKEIVEADADYVLALKGNQEKVREEVKSFLDATLQEKQDNAGPKAPWCQRRCRPSKPWQRWKKTTAASKLENIIRAIVSGGLPIKENGRGWLPSAASGVGPVNWRNREPPWNIATYLSSLKPRRGSFCSRRAGPLGRRKQTPLGTGRVFGEDRSQGARRLRCRKLSHPAQAGLEPVAARENQKTWHPRQNA